jgi:vanillate O-demethylase ferredoxin subunit
VQAEWIKVRIAERAMVAPDIVSLSMEALHTNVLPPYEAGAHIDVKLPNGHIRQYSLCGDPRRSDRYELGILRDPKSRGGSASVHDDLNEGDVLEISAPRNLFPLVPGKHAVLIAGGIGVTPILAMATHLAAEGQSFEVHYFVRAEDRIVFRDRLADIGTSGTAHVHIGERIPASFDPALVFGTPDPDTHLYVCGPGGFMDAILDMARGAGWQATNLHSERFTPAAVAHDTDAAFEIEIDGTGQVVTVAAGQTAAAALAEAGIAVPLSCEQGICGTCIARVVSGTPDHRDSYLSDEERDANDCFAPCCSRARSDRLVINL